MKKFLLVFMQIIIFLSVCISVCAEGTQSYNLAELNMSIEIPAEYAVFTRNTEQNDPNLSAYGLTKSDMLTFMESNNIYLSALDKKATTEISVTMSENEIKSINHLSDATLSEFEAQLVSNYSDNGFTVRKYEIYQHSQTKFVKIFYSGLLNDNMSYGIQCFTIYDNKAVSITMQSNSGAIDQSKEAVLNGIVDSTKFVIVPLDLSDYFKTENHLYKDNNTGVEFKLPENWVESELLKERKYIDVKFTYNSDPEICILYGSFNFMDEIPENERKRYNRQSINNSMFSEANLAEMMNISPGDVQKETFGGKEYFKFFSHQAMPVYGIELEVYVTAFFRIENGYGYMFQFTGTSDSAYYGDFEKLLSSVKYASDKLEEKEKYINKDDLMFNYILFSLFMTIMIYSFPIYFYRFAIRKKPVEKKKAKKITIIYGIIAYIVMSLILIVQSGHVARGSIVFWSFVNYLMLSIKGKPADTDLQDNPDDNICSDTNPDDSLEQTVQDFDNELLQDESVQPADDKDFADDATMP